MAKSFGCHCGERLKPVRDRAWVALTKRVHTSPPRSATMKCLNCGKLGRSNAAYVDEVRYVSTLAELKHFVDLLQDKKEKEDGPAHT